MHAEQLAQGIHCGPLALALGYDWAQEVVEQYTLVAVPRAPVWLLGAASLSGIVTPVCDLRLFFQAEAIDEPIGRQSERLLIGKSQSDQGSAPLALLFQGLPTQLMGEVLPLEKSVGSESTLRSCAMGRISSSAGELFTLLDPGRLLQRLQESL